MRSIGGIVFAAALGICGAAEAQQPTIAAACNTKVICVGVQLGAGRMMDCLADHMSVLSDACFAAIGRQALTARANRPAAPAAPAAGAAQPPAANPPADPSEN